MKEDQYLDSGDWDWILGLGFSFGLIKKVFEIEVVCCSGLISAISSGMENFAAKWRLLQGLGFLVHGV